MVSKTKECNAGVADIVPSLKSSCLEQSKISKVEALVQDLILSTSTIAKIRTVFEAEMDLGLSVNPSKKSSLEMVNTYVPQLPNGTEEGKYLALDLGGTNFRTILVELVAGRLVKEKVKYFEVPEALRLGPGTDLFDFLAASIHQFLKEQGLLNEHLDLGFTFSFPMHQKSLRSATLVTWTKSFNSPGVTGNDVVVLLEEAIQRRGDLRVHVATVLNDTTGTLIQGAYVDPSCAVGLILGTGSNACYIERAERVLNWEGERPSNDSEVIMDIEWGAFGDNGVLDFIRTEYDRAVDNTSLLPNSYTFEKYIAGKYLGEIVRVVLLKMYSAGLVFDGKASDKFLAHGAITTRHVSLIEEDSINNSTSHCVALLRELELPYEQSDIEILKYVCYVVSDRAAKLVSICLATILDRMARPGSVMIAVDGSLFQFHPRFKALMQKYISEYAPLRQFHLMLAEDGSGKGAGLTTAIATRLQKQQ